MNRIGKKLRSMLSVLLGIATVGMLLLFALQAVRIYQAGLTGNADASGLREMYSPRIVREYYSRIAWSVRLWTVLLIARLAVGQLPKGQPAAIPPEMRLLQRKQRVNWRGCAEAVREEKYRMKVDFSAGGMLLIAAVWILAYLLDGRNFVSWELESVMGALMLRLIPAAGVSFCILWTASLLKEKSMTRELGALKEAEKAREVVKADSGRVVLAVRILIACAALVLLSLGIANGGMKDVLVKAINICTECIGLG